MRLLLIRHGMPEEHSETRPQNPPLNADGLRQAQAVAQRLANEGIERIVSSPMQRALDTAGPLAGTLGLPVDIIDGWAEADGNTPKYRTRATLRAMGPETWNAFLEDPLRFLGVDPDRFKAGVLGALEEVLTDRKSGCVAVFAHGLPINVVLSHALGLDRLTHFAPHFGSITRLQGSAIGALGVVSINETFHLGAVPAERNGS